MNLSMRIDYQYGVMYLPVSNFGSPKSGYMVNYLLTETHTRIIEI